jgi:hypothetical protein
MHPRSLISTLLLPAFSVEDTLGALSIGALVSLFLFGAITLQVYMYLIHFRNDNRNLKMLVSATYLQRRFTRWVLYILIESFLGGLCMVSCFGRKSSQCIVLNAWIRTCELAHSIAVAHLLYYVTISRYGDLTVLLHPPKSLGVAVLLGGLETWVIKVRLICVE